MIRVPVHVHSNSNVPVLVFEFSSCDRVFMCRVGLCRSLEKVKTLGRYSHESVK